MASAHWDVSAVVDGPFVALRHSAGRADASAFESPDRDCSEARESDAREHPDDTKPSETTSTRTRAINIPPRVSQTAPGTATRVTWIGADTWERGWRRSRRGNPNQLPFFDMAGDHGPRDALAHSPTRHTGKQRALGVLLLGAMIVASCAYTADDPSEPSMSVPKKPGIFSAPCWTTNVDGAWASSPTVSDLTGDGVLDIVVGTINSPAFVVAVDGANGVILWKSEVPRDVYTSAAFIDANGDSTPDVVMGGRSNDLFAFDGRTGSTLWSARLANPSLPELWFGSATPVGDLNGDGTIDILAPQSGEDTGNLRAGYLHLLSGADGTVLRTDTTPDAKEIYSPPFVIEGVPLSDQDVYLGTGGESVQGAVSALRYGPTLSDAPRLAWSVPTDGVVAPPVTAVFGMRKVVLATTWGAETLAIDAESGTVLWRNHRRGHVSAAPVAVPASEKGWVLVTSSAGETFPPVGEDSVVRWIDTSSGSMIRERDLDGLSATDPILFDFDDDGRQDLLVAPVHEAFAGRSDEKGELLILDTEDGDPLASAGFARFAASTPLIADLDDDGLAELVHTSQTGIRCYRLTTAIGANRVAAGYRHTR